VKIAWRRYFKSRTLTSFSSLDYDYFPKGTGFFLAPKTDLLEACESFDSLYVDKSLASDDTHLIRPLAEKHKIYIGPEFICTYFSRDSFLKFVHHTFFRGTTFVDGYFRRDSRFLIPLLLILPVLSLALYLAWTYPLLIGLLTPLFISSVAGALRVNNCSWAEVRGFIAVSPIFAPIYFLGIIRGFVLAFRGRHK
jgi:hypothetical protein